MRNAVALTLSLFLAFAAAAADKNDVKKADEQAIRKAFSDWAAAYNTQNTEAALALWHKDMIGSHAGGPEFRYADLIKGYRMTFADLVVQRTNEVIVEEIQINGDVAWARWKFLQSEESLKAPPKKILTKCLGVFVRQPDGAWQIVRWMSAPANNR